MNALGMVEVFGFTTGICCADIAAKAADVKIIALDKNKPLNGDSAEVPLIMNVKMEGSVAAVEEAVAAAKAHAVAKGLYVTSHIIPRPGIGTEKLAAISEVGRDRWIGDIRVKETEETSKKSETSVVEKTEKVEEKPQNNANEQITIQTEDNNNTEKDKTNGKPRGRKPKNK